ncbi:uncharacterized protein LOC143806795 isoform X2 [Ranitomeya variabilis]|uniref:uncharacterized protein LOC143806795 isoform X2 n=1 Tax=Ranitomeya variabilis TaxID=490064 RepID=UPI0040575BAC
MCQHLARQYLIKLLAANGLRFFGGVCSPVVLVSKNCVSFFLFLCRETTPATGIGGSHNCSHQRQPTARTVPETPPASGIGGSHYCGHQRQPTARTVPETPPASAAATTAATSGSPQPGPSQRRHRHRASAAATTAATSGSPQPGPSHAVTPPLQTTPPFRYPSSSPGSACFSPASSSPALALAHARGWVVSSSSDEQQASFLQPDTVRGLLAKQQRMERTVALLMQQVQQHGRTLRHLLRHGRM